MFKVHHTLPITSNPVFLDIFSLSRYNQTYSAFVVLRGNLLKAPVCRNFGLHGYGAKDICGDGVSVSGISLKEFGMKKNRFYSAGIAALLAAVLTAGFSGCSMNSGTETPAGGQGSAEEALVKEMRKYTAGFVFGFDEDDIGTDITRRVIELKEKERADRSVHVSVAGVDGSGYFTLENGVLRLADLPPKPSEQAAGGDTDGNARELYEMYPGVGEITLEFKKGDRVLPFNVMIRMVEPETEGARIAELEWASPLPFGYDMINRSYLVLDVYKDKIRDPILDFGLLLCFGFISSYDTRAWPDVEHQIFVYNYALDSQGNETRTVDFHVLGTAADTQFQIDVLFSPADAILKKYGTHLLTRARWTGNMTEETKFSHSDEDLIPIWELIPHNKLSSYFDEPVVRQKAEELKKEFERQMQLQDRT